jgi:hypothetical protein
MEHAFYLASDLYSGAVAPIRALAGDTPVVEDQVAPDWR